MTFADLPSATQILVQFRFDFLAKAYLFLFCLIFAIAYIWYFRPKQEPTPFMLVGFLRLVSLFMSWIFVVLSPLLILLLSPKVPLDLFIEIMLGAYLVLIIFLTAIMFMNIFYFGGWWLVDLMNVSPENAKMKKVKQILANSDRSIHEKSN